MDVLTFDGRLDYSGRLSDPQVFWIATQLGSILHPILAL